MSDYFALLAARLAGASAAARPVIRTRFEPETPLPGAPAADSPDPNGPPGAFSETTREVPAPPPTPPMPPRRFPAPARDTAERPPAPAPLESQVPAIPDAERRTARPDPAPRPSDVPAETAASSVRAEASSPRDPLPSQTPIRPAPESTAEREPGPARQPAPVARIAPPESRSLATESASEVVPASEPTGQTRRIRVSPEAMRRSEHEEPAEAGANSRPATVRPFGDGVAPRGNAAAPRPGTERGGAEPPTIEITIGRIEVQAVFPPAVIAPPVAPRKPTQSLEDYLERRNGNGR